MHVYKCDKKNDIANYIPEKVVETLVKSTEEGKNLAAKDFLEEEIAKDKKLKIRLIQVAKNKC